MIVKESASRRRAVQQVAEQMMLAARTAPKARGCDSLIILSLFDDNLQKLADKMEEIGQRTDTAFFIRDAKCVRVSQAAVLVGTRIEPRRLNHCGMCGMGNCDNKLTAPDVPCAMNTMDLGIALGSAAATAAQFHTDSRIMFSAGKAAIALNFFNEDIHVAFGIPLSCSAKSPFFDR